MKKFIGWLLSWAFYWIGDAFSQVLNYSPEWMPQIWFDAWYTQYNYCMCLSSRVQDWGGSGAWKKSQP